MPFDVRCWENIPHSRVWAQFCLVLASLCLGACGTAKVGKPVSSTQIAPMSAIRLPSPLTDDCRFVGVVDFDLPIPSSPDNGVSHRQSYGMLSSPEANVWLHKDEHDHPVVELSYATEGWNVEQRLDPTRSFSVAIKDRMNLSANVAAVAGTRFMVTQIDSNNVVLQPRTNPLLEFHQNLALATTCANLSFAFEMPPKLPESDAQQWLTPTLKEDVVVYDAVGGNLVATVHFKAMTHSLVSIFGEPIELLERKGAWVLLRWPLIYGAIVTGWAKEAGFTVRAAADGGIGALMGDQSPTAKSPGRRCVASSMQTVYSRYSEDGEVYTFGTIEAGAPFYVRAEEEGVATVAAPSGWKTAQPLFLNLPAAELSCTD